MFDRLEYQRKWHKEHPNYQKELRQKNLEKVRERDRKYYQKTKEIKNARSKQYQIKNKEKIIKQKKTYYQKNKNEINQKNKENYQKNKKQILRKNKEYHEKNQEKIRDWNNQFNKKWYLKNKNRVKQIKRKYRENKPEILLKSQTNYLKKLGIPLSLTAHQYKRALMAWAKVIKKRDNSCVICGSTDKLHAHHIIQRATRPELSFILNNGIMLCDIHHREVHGQNLIKWLLEIKN